MISTKVDETAFKIQLTRSGIEVVTDPVHLRICDLLKGTGGMRPSDLSSEVGVASSSLHFVLDKLIDCGVVSRHKPDPDRKSVVYRMSSTTVLERRNPPRAAATDPYPVPDEGAFSWGDLLMTYLDDLGIESSYFQDRYAEFLSERHGDTGRAFKLEDAVFESKKTVSKLTGYGINVFSLNPLTIIIDGDGSLPRNVGLVASFFSKLVRRMSSSYGAVASISDIGDGVRHRYKATLSNIQGPEDTTPSVGTEDGPASSKFAIVGKDGRSATVTNDLQIDILKTLHDGPCGITEIMRRTSSPRSTVTSNLTKLSESGIVIPVHADSDLASYAIALPVTLMKTGPASFEDRHHREDERIGASFMDGFFEFAMDELSSLGFDSDMLSEQIGRHHAERSRDPEKTLASLASAAGASVKKDGGRIVLALEPGPKGSTVIGAARQTVDPVDGGVVDRGPPGCEIMVRKFREGTCRQESFRKSGQHARHGSNGKGLIVSLAVLVLLLAFLAANPAHDVSYNVYADVSDENLTFFDEDGDEMRFPIVVKAGDAVRFSVSDEGCTLFILDGATTSTSKCGSIYMIKPCSDVTLKPMWKSDCHMPPGGPRANGHSWWQCVGAWHPDPCCRDFGAGALAQEACWMEGPAHCHPFPCHWGFGLAPQNPLTRP